MSAFRRLVATFDSAGLFEIASAIVVALAFLDFLQAVAGAIVGLFETKYEDSTYLDLERIFGELTTVSATACSNSLRSSRA